MRVAEPGDKLVLEGIQLEVEMFGLARFGRRVVDLAVRIYQPARGFRLIILIAAGDPSLFGLQRVENGAALVALVTPSSWVAAYRALSLDETIGQEGVVRLMNAEGLDSLALFDVAVLPELAKDILDNGGLVGGGGLVENIEIDAEPLVDGLVKGVVLGAERRGVDAFLERLRFRRGAVLVLSV